MSFTVRNHYVPIWYQRRFLNPGESKYWYLDLKPEVIKRPDGTSTHRRATRHLGPVNCFRQDHLYTLYFGNDASDVIEKSFFGELDRMGERAIPFFANYRISDEMHDAFRGMIDYLAAQLFRTPKGLQILRTLSRETSHQSLLMMLQRLWRLYQTIWVEAVWEVVNCDSSPTKFIVSDSPVVTYNRGVYPGAAEVQRFGMASFERIGTHTLFPIDSNRCLVLTNLQYVRNPKGNPMKIRENPRYFADSLFDLRKVQRGREISECEVIAINYLLKTHAVRYIAASNRDWLYPEAQMRIGPWPKLGGSLFLMPDPRKVSFTTGFYAGFEDGGAWGINEYGHRVADNKRAQALRAVEWHTFHSAKRAWDERDRREGREPPADLKDYF